MYEQRGELVSEQISGNREHREDQNDRNYSDEYISNDKAVAQAPEKLVSYPANEKQNGGNDENKLKESAPSGEDSSPLGLCRRRERQELRHKVESAYPGRQNPPSPARVQT